MASQGNEHDFQDRDNDGKTVESASVCMSMSDLAADVLAASFALIMM